MLTELPGKSGGRNENPVVDTTTPEYLQSIRPLIAELERYIGWVSSSYQMNINQKFTVTIQTKGRANKYGHFGPDRWLTKEGEKVHEILVAAEELHRDPYDVLHTVHHELVHLCNHIRGVEDCARSGRHNQRFKLAAETFGLEVGTPDNSHGFAFTKMSQQLRSVVEDAFQPNLDVFVLYRIANPIRPKVMARNVKFVCSNGCDTIARASKGTRLQCGICGAALRIG